MRSMARWLTALGVAALLLVPVAGRAHDPSKLPKGPIRDRNWLMKNMSNQAKDIDEAFDLGDEGFDTSVIQSAAGAIAMSAHRMPHLFPKGSTDPNSRALPAIWTDWDKFTALAKQLEDQAASLQRAAGAEDDENLHHKVDKLFATCKSCHDQFRKPSEKKK